MAKKYVSYNEVKGIEGFSILENKGLLRKGPGSALQVAKNGEFVSLPIDRLENFKEWLASKTAPAPAPAPTVPEDWSSIWFSLPTVDSVEGKGNSLKRFSLKVWCDLLVRDGVSLAQAKYILENRGNKALLNNAFKSTKCTLSDTWKKRFLK
ncbi:MAG: hypothetical protein ACRCWN_06285 [Fusobacteriaceae bacterium]